MAADKRCCRACVAASPTGCSSGTCCWRTHAELRMSNSDFNCNKWPRRVIIQISARAIITCHRCHCCSASAFVPGLVLPLKSRRCFCLGAHLILALRRRLQPARASPRLCLQAVHLLLRGCAAMAERACVQVYPCSRARREWAAAEKRRLVPADTSAFREEGVTNKCCEVLSV